MSVVVDPYLVDVEVGGLYMVWDYGLGEMFLVVVERIVDIEELDPMVHQVYVNSNTVKSPLRIAVGTAKNYTTKQDKTMYIPLPPGKTVKIVKAEPIKSLGVLE